MLNTAVLIGRLTKDPELRYTAGASIAVCTFTLAVDRPVAKGEDKQADFIPVVCWRQQAESVAKYLKKGNKAAVEGRIQVRNYENNEARRIYVTEVIANNVHFLESAKTEHGQPEPVDISDDELPF